jgi:hypothetical protein
MLHGITSFHQSCRPCSVGPNIKQGFRCYVGNTSFQQSCRPCSGGPNIRQGWWGQVGNTSELPALQCGPKHKTGMVGPGWDYFILSRLTDGQQSCRVLSMKYDRGRVYTVKKGSRVSRPQPGCHYQTLPGRE